MLGHGLPHGEGWSCVARPSLKANPRGSRRLGFVLVLEDDRDQPCPRLLDTTANSFNVSSCRKIPAGFLESVRHPHGRILQSRNPARRGIHINGKRR